MRRFRTFRILAGSLLSLLALTAFASCGARTEVVDPGRSAAGGAGGTLDVTSNASSSTAVSGSSAVSSVVSVGPSTGQFMPGCGSRVVDPDVGCQACAEQSCCPE